MSNLSKPYAITLVIVKKNKTTVKGYYYKNLAPAEMKYMKLKKKHIDGGIENSGNSINKNFK